MTGSVKDYYEHFGWEKGEGDVYQDTAKNVDLRPVMMRYCETLHRRGKRKLGNGGKYFLDIGCGANPAVDYRFLLWFYKKWLRIVPKKSSDQRSDHGVQKC